MVSRRNKLLAMVAGAEVDSEHFLAKTIVDYAKEHQVSPLEVNQFSNIPGRGIRAQVAGCDVLIGNRRWLGNEIVDELGLV